MHVFAGGGAAAGGVGGASCEAKVDTSVLSVVNGEKRFLLAIREGSAD